jgi:1-deoxy-D-xylulose-5-phosphate synthase
LIHYSSVGCEDKTHRGIFTAPIYANVPNIQVLVPTCKKELIAMLDWSLNQKEHPTMIFVPRGDVSYRDVDTNFTMGKFLVEKKGSEIAIIAVAAMFDRGNELVESIKKEMNIDATLINPRFISGVDKETLDMLKKDHKLVVTLEDNCKNGGFGEKVAEFYGDSNMKVKSFGLEKLFYEIYEQDDVFKEYNLTNEKILEQIKNIYKSI